jgi:hypothetical protein
MTASYVNRDIRRAEIVNLANGMLRHRFGYAPKSRSIRGPSYLGKAVMQKLLRDGRWLRRERTARRLIDFRLDADHPGWRSRNSSMPSGSLACCEIVDLPKAA